jgi:hypothetical protein
VGSFDELVAEALSRLAAVGPGDIGPQAARRLAHDDDPFVNRVDPVVLAPGGGKELLSLAGVADEDRLAGEQDQRGDRVPIVFDLPEAAALVSSLAVLGPSVSASAASAMRKLAEALNPANSPAT